MADELEALILDGSVTKKQALSDNIIKSTPSPSVWIKFDRDRT